MKSSASTSALRNILRAPSEDARSSHYLKQSQTPQTLKRPGRHHDPLSKSLSPNPDRRVPVSNESGPKIDIFSGGGSLLSDMTKSLLGLGHKKKEEHSSEDDESTDTEIGDIIEE